MCYLYMYLSTFFLYDRNHVPCNPYVIVLFSPYDYGLYDHMPHFLMCINFILLNNLYQHTYMIIHLMYNIFILFYVLYFIFMYYMMYVSILYCSSVDHLKLYASH